MGEIFITIFLFFGVIVLTAIVFGGWVVVSLVKIVIRGLNRMLEPAKTVSILPKSARTVRCGRDRCAADNPHDARFCRRCGRMLTPEAQRVQVRRAAAMF
jgi:hypothetical protein